MGTAAGWFPEIARRPEVVGPREMGRRLGGVGDGPDGGSTARPVMWGRRRLDRGPMERYRATNGVADSPTTAVGEWR